MEKENRPQATQEMTKVPAESTVSQKEIDFDNLNTAEQKAYQLIAENDPTGQKLKIFIEAVEHSKNNVPVAAEIPIYHSTGSYGLAKILETGAVSSKRNQVTGEKAATGEQTAKTSFVIGGYGQSEIVSYFYARKNERKSSLLLDKSDVTGQSCEEDIVSQVFSEVPDLKPEERLVVVEAIAQMKGVRVIDDKKLMEEKLKDLRGRKYFLDITAVKDQLKHDQLLLELTDPKGEEYYQLKQSVGKLSDRIANYEAETDEMKAAMIDPFPVILTYEGKGLPKADLKTLVGGLISERRTEQPILNSDLNEIRVPKIKVDKVKEWISRRIGQLEETSVERKALEAVRITPLEYFEAGQIVKDFNQNPSSENM